MEPIMSAFGNATMSPKVKKCNGNARRCYNWPLSPPNPLARMLEKSLLPDSIRTRTVLTLLVGLTASHLASIALYSFARNGDGPAWSHGSIASTLVMAVAIVAFSWWASGWITAPLSEFAQASERLGVDVNAPPLAEDGPEEVRAAARAFNQMQIRIRSFVEDRLRMLAAISHDLRGPITRLRLRIEQIDMDPRAQAKMLVRPRRDGADGRIPVSLSPATRRPTRPASRSTSPRFSKRCATTRSTPAASAEFEWEGRLVYQGRPLAMKRLFANLIDNALRYGGDVTVSASNDQASCGSSSTTGVPEFPNSERENVFRPFFRLEKSRNKRTGGIGLGLATARSIARAHGGDVVLANRPEGGLRATVTLPRRSAVGARRAVASEPHILIVDDDIEICQLVARFLEPHGFRVTSAGDGPSMRAALQREPADLIILDLMLPGEDGLALCREICGPRAAFRSSSSRRSTARRTGSWASKWGPTTICRSPSAPANCWRAMRAVLRRAAPTVGRSPSKQTPKAA